MRILSVGLFTCLWAYQVSVACADEAKQQAPAAPQSAQSSAPATPACTPSATTPCPAATSNTTVARITPADSATATDAALDKTLRSQGYKPEMKNDTKYYCRRETVLGSHFESKVCSTPDQLRATQQNSKDVMDRFQREQPGPAGK